MNEPPPLGRVKSLRVPAGKEHEYAEDIQGEPVHVTYGADENLPGTVIPTGKHFSAGGGSRGFSIDDMDIPQNIIACDAQGQQVITQVTRRQMMRTATKSSTPLPSKEELKQRQAAPVEEIRKLADQSEAQFLAAAATSTAAVVETPPSRNEVLDPFEEGVEVVMPTRRKAKRAKKGKKPRRVVESVGVEQPSDTPAGQGQEQPDNRVAVVRIVGPFGQIDAHCSGIFRDGIHLVLFTDRRQLQNVFSLPPVDDPIKLKVRYGDHTVTCFWAGIQFTMPSGQVTFTVLLIAEEEANGIDAHAVETRVDNGLPTL